MIDGIRRKIRGPGVEESTWDLDSQMNVEEIDSPLLITDREVLALADPIPSDFTAKTIVGDSGYYHRFIESCIQSGGKFGDHQISMGWLRTMLAGLEGVNLGTEMMWDQEPRDEEVEVATPRGPQFANSTQVNGQPPFDF